MTDEELDKLYAKAYTEVLEVLRHAPKEIVALIPEQDMNIFKKYSDPDYEWHFDTSKPFNKQNMLEETKATLAYVYNKFIKGKESATESRLDQYDKMSEGECDD
ncbi:MAG: hypothetical protein NC489_10735 [Ruminococcus flavefaciens]|nr:hypothetical protein [Ruminococcus flavefaciens]